MDPAFSVGEYRPHLEPVPSSANDNFLINDDFDLVSPYAFGRDMPNSLAATTQQAHADFAVTLAVLEPSINNTQDDVGLPASRPEITVFEAGIYSCTYRGCTRRFDTPACLKKHRRTHLSIPGRGLSVRNSQTGPYRCDRINPSTGRPCSREFSRPYDLTRHEDTKHNVSKLKIRCHLCEEIKTFSRNDALTRHMRTVHPSVTWPGKAEARQ
ncbi:SILG protein [Arthroderma uncinatum]|uniref:SILG protein n=1 Tax=Arthroderma uncinatum TaxID=74035 RepID=UPI00144AA530|nr:SILG protein [Arthroderma uncinatum]KAF3492100.1 SILG protein [Arthroderma uncinatum]